MLRRQHILSHSGDHATTERFNLYQAFFLTHEADPKKCDDPMSSDIPQDTTIDIGRYARTLRRHILIILAFCVVGVLIAVLSLRFSTYSYTVTLQVTPVTEGKDTLSTSNLTGLASLAGITLPLAGNQTQLELYLAALSAPDVAGDIVNNMD